MALASAACASSSSTKTPTVQDGGGDDDDDLHVSQPLYGGPPLEASVVDASPEAGEDSSDAGHD